MFYVKPITIGPAGHTPIDPDRRDCLPKGMWRAVPENPYWLRLLAMRDVELRHGDNPPAVSEMEGYEPPPPEPAKPVPAKPAEAKPAEAKPAKSEEPAKGSDA